MICSASSTLSEVEIGNLDKCKNLLVLFYGFYEEVQSGVGCYLNKVVSRVAFSNFIPVGVCIHGAWGVQLKCFSQQADLQHASIDGTINYAHACAVGYKENWQIRKY